MPERTTSQGHSGTLTVTRHALTRTSVIPAHDTKISSQFNILLIDRAICVVQPYLPQARGVDSPTFVITDNTAAEGLFPVFDQVFNEMWERSRPA
ncbi:DUF5919 domain-containing protein [Nonomuraea sp. NPDC059023]|uniref:DUF5919 domain-containing protein n=1 Tax=unclassified Nonomuraea TaxID=2593643 RepID=UPI0036CF6C05